MHCCAFLYLLPHLSDPPVILLFQVNFTDFPGIGEPPDSMPSAHFLIVFGVHLLSISVSLHTVPTLQQSEGLLRTHIPLEQWWSL